MTNQPAGNTIVRFARSGNGSLARIDETATGGLGGTGNGIGIFDPLGSADSLIQNDSGNLLLAVNAGSNEVSSLRAGANGLTLVNKVPSGGEFPNSVAMSGRLVYVLNAHGTPNITGFTIGPDGNLAPLANSTVALPGGVDAMAHDIRFTPDGLSLIVTEGGRNQLDIFDLGDDGLVTGVVARPSAGMGPFGFKFARRGVLVSTEAMSASVSSYNLTGDNALQPISPAVPNGQAATCWIDFTRTGHAFVSNTAAGTLSSYQIGASGNLSLARAVAIKEVGAPIDLSLTNDGKFLYVVDSSSGRVRIFEVRGTGLVARGFVNGLPQTIQGIIAR